MLATSTSILLAKASASFVSVDASVERKHVWCITSCMEGVQGYRWWPSAYTPPSTSSTPSPSRELDFVLSLSRLFLSLTLLLLLYPSGKECNTCNDVVMAHAQHYITNIKEPEFSQKEELALWLFVHRICVYRYRPIKPVPGVLQGRLLAWLNPLNVHPIHSHRPQRSLRPSKSTIIFLVYDVLRN